MTLPSRLARWAVVLCFAAVTRADVTLRLDSVVSIPETPRVLLALSAQGSGELTALQFRLAYNRIDLRFAGLDLTGGAVTPDHVGALSAVGDADRGIATILLELTVPVTLGGEPVKLCDAVFAVGGGLQPAETLPVRFDGAPTATASGHTLTAAAHDGAITISEENWLILGNAWGYPGQSRIPVELRASNADPLMGMQVSSAFDASALALAAVTTENTMTEALRCEFFQPIIDNDMGTVIIGILLDNEPPFDPSRRYPVTGYRLRIARMVFDVRHDAAPDQDVALRLVDNLGTPPIKNRVVVDNESIAPRTIDGTFRVGRVPVFLRGDANGDGRVDIADPVMILLHLFKDYTIPCQKAADADDDGKIRVNDAQYLLNYLFLGGRAIPPPFPQPGTDPTQDDLSCAG